MSILPETLARAYEPQIAEKRESYVQLWRLNDADIPDQGRTFQYFPDTLQDTKGVNWTPKDIPGGSLPLYQWTSSGERSISFTAQLTTDVDLSQQPDPSAYNSDRRNIDIRSAVVWLRSFILPRYSKTVGDSSVGGGDLGMGLTKAPSKALLMIPGSGIGLAGGYEPLLGSADSIICVMSECSVEWQAYFPSGMPRLASVSLGFLQVPQFQGQVAFPSASDEMLEAALEGRPMGKIPFLGYRIL